MPYRLSVHITLEKPLLNGQTGVALHSAIHRAIGAQDAVLARMMHEAQTTPFSLAMEPTKSRYQQTFTVSVLDEALTDVFLAALKVGTIIGKDNEPLVGFISSLALSGKPYEAMIAGIPDRPRHELVMRFVSCTALKSGRKTITTPRPDLIWNGLARRWQTLSPYKLTGDYSAWFASHLHCLHDGTAFCKESVGKGTVRGFRGSARYLFNDDDEGAGVAWLLATFATYAGVGVKTAFGCGLTRLS